MYERFTDRARKTMQWANEYALSRRHEYIGVEHILRGLVMNNGMTLAKAVFAEFGVTQARVEEVLAKQVPDGLPGFIEGRLPMTPRAKKLIENAIEVARELGNNYVGTEHLLLGLVKLDDGNPAFDCFKAMEVTPAAIEARMLALLENPLDSNVVTASGVVRELLAVVLDGLAAQYEAVQKETSGASLRKAAKVLRNIA